MKIDSTDYNDTLSVRGSTAGGSGMRPTTEAKRGLEESLLQGTRTTIEADMSPWEFTGAGIRIVLTTGTTMQRTDVEATQCDSAHRGLRQDGTPPVVRL